MDPFAQASQQNQQTQPDPEQTLAATDQALEKKQKQEQPVPNQFAITQAIAQLNPNGRDPQSQVGKAIASPAYAGYCQGFVDDNTNPSQRYPTAFATWQAKSQLGQAHEGLDGLQPGDVVEFAPDKSNGNLGHAALVQKNGDLKMATYNGVQTFSLKNWINYSGQTPLGYYRPT